MAPYQVLSLLSAIRCRYETERTARFLSNGEDRVKSIELMKIRMRMEMTNVTKKIDMIKRDVAMIIVFLLIVVVGSGMLMVNLFMKDPSLIHAPTASSTLFAILVGIFCIFAGLIIYKALDQGYTE